MRSFVSKEGVAARGGGTFMEGRIMQNVQGKRSPCKQRQWCPRLSPVTTNIGATSCFVANVPWRKTKVCQLAWQNISPCMMATTVFCSNNSVRISQKTHTIVTNTGCLMFSSTIASYSENHTKHVAQVRGEAGGIYSYLPVSFEP
jgi:hypothetical protein